MSEPAKQQAYRLFNQGLLNEAHRYVRQLLSSDPSDAALWLLDSQICARQNRLSEAVSSCGRSLALQRSYEGLLTLGQIHLVAGDTDQAERHLVDAAGERPDRKEVRVLLANLYANQNRFDEALPVYRHLVEQGHADADLLGNMAQTLEALRQSDQARETAEQALQRDPNHPASHLVLARLERGAGRLPDAIARLSAVAGRHDGTVAGAGLLTELGLDLDRVGEYGRAFDCFRRANEFWQHKVPEVSSAKALYPDRIRRHRAYFSDGAAAALPGPAANLVFFVGFPRSGTTLIEEILRTATDVVTTREEPLINALIDTLAPGHGNDAAYPARLAGLTSAELQALRDAYLAGLHRVIGMDARDRIYVDKLPLNLIEVGFIRMLFPEARFLVAIRDPRDVCLSCYMQSFRLNPAMVHFLDIQDTARFYAETLGLWNHYKAVFAGLTYLEYRYEDLIDDFDGTAARILAFVGSKRATDIRAFHHQAARSVARTPSYIDVSQPLYRRAMGRWRNYSRQLEGVSEVLAPYVEQFGYAT